MLFYFVILFCIVGYLCFFLTDLMFCFILETVVPIFRCVLSLPSVSGGDIVPLQAGQLLGQLLQTPFCGAFSWFFNQDLEDWAIFLPISCFLLVSAALYFLFGSVVGELTLFSFLRSFILSSIQISSRKDPLL